MPPKITEFLAVLQILLIHARHLSLTLERRAKLSHFSEIADGFGTAKLPLIFARLTRGLLRIQALQRVLLDRARRGRDLVRLKPLCFSEQERHPSARKPDTQQAEAAGRRPPVRRRPRDEAPDPFNMPTLQQLEAEIRRRPLGRALADICRDLGIGPCLCDNWTWDDLYRLMRRYRGDFEHYYLDIRRRQRDYIQEWDRDPTLDEPMGRADLVRNVLGARIGEAWPFIPPDLPPRGAPAGWQPVAASHPP